MQGYHGVPEGRYGVVDLCQEDDVSNCQSYLENVNGDVIKGRFIKEGMIGRDLSKCTCLSGLKGGRRVNTVLTFGFITGPGV